MIRYLKQDEKDRSRALWEEAFPEDSMGFCDYYFTEKVRDNKILVSEEDGRIRSMVHLNPYQVKVRDRSCRLDYIVGVATAMDSRRQGRMRGLLCRMLEDMYQEQKPFTFLMPADPKIYEPFDFSYIFDQPKWRLREGGIVGREPWKAGHPVSAGDLAGWMNHLLSQGHEVFCLRDSAYVERLSKELASEGGGLELLYMRRDGDGRMRPAAEIDGIYAEWGLTKKEVRALLCRSGMRVEAGPAKPAIMARIVDLGKMVRAVGLREDWEEDEVVVPIEVEDRLLPGNRGRYLWHLVKEGSWLEQAEGFKGASGGMFHPAPIASLAGWLFGYEPLPGWAKAVRPIQGVFLDEVV